MRPMVDEMLLECHCLYRRSFRGRQERCVDQRESLVRLTCFGNDATVFDGFVFRRCRCRWFLSSMMFNLRE